MTTFARSLAEQRPDEVALADARADLGWADVDDACNRAANALAGLDLGPERRVAVFAENATETALAHLGGLLGGCSVVPTSFHLGPDELAYILEDSDTRLLFVGPETAERGLAAASIAGVDTVVGWRCERPYLVPTYLPTCLPSYLPTILHVHRRAGAASDVRAACGDSRDASDGLWPRARGIADAAGVCRK